MAIYEIYPNELIKKVAEELKKNENIKPPAWSQFAKTGAHKERAPLQGDWWYIRAAAVLRAVYTLGPIGVSKLRTKYGGKKRRGHKMPKFKRGSGSVIRKVLQQLEKAELIKFNEKGVHKGRVVTPKGASLLDKSAAALSKARPKVKKTAKESVKPKEPVKPEAKELVKSPQPVKSEESVKPEAPKNG